MWPWKREVRQAAGSYSDTLIAGLIAQATGNVKADPGTTAAVEAAAGIWSRGLASATVEGDPSRTRSITPDFLAMVARQWIRVGESIHVVVVTDDGVRLAPASTWDLTGGASPDTWSYRLDIEGPSGGKTVQVPSAGVIHSRWATDPRRPWQGLSPMAYATTSGVLLANVEKRLAEEAGGPVGHLLPVPADGGDGSVDDPFGRFETDRRQAGRPGCVGGDNFRRMG